ncbi:hypothetical protein HY570_01150, partial [Candidatus Micrarchaeota archaeon]|nr:hypothetical protein [Candidatus Micrarchaeota archaeon]
KMGVKEGDRVILNISGDILMVSKKDPGVFDNFEDFLPEKFEKTLKKIRSDEKERSKAANTATIVASAFLILFILFGDGILDLFGISFKSFQIGGGVILLLIGIQLALGYALAREEEEVSVAAVLIGVPLITGPGALTTSIVLVSTYGPLVTLSAAIVSLVLCWLSLRNASFIYNLLGKRLLSSLSRVIGLLLAGIAVELILSGLRV